jgi:tRNA-binding protein
MITPPDTDAPAPDARPEVTAEHFFAVDVRVGTVVAAEPFAGARVPALKLRIDFGPALGVRQSSAQLTRRYAPADLVGRQVLAVVNLPSRRVAGYRSEVLVLGAVPAAGDVALLAVDGPVPDGTRVA